MRYVIGHWVRNQHNQNPRLPDLSFEEVGQISRKLPDSDPLLLEEARSITDYPLRDRGQEFYLTPNRNYVIEVRRREDGMPLVVSILSAIIIPEEIRS